MRSNFSSGFEKTAVVGAVLGALGRGALGALKSGGGLYTRAITGNIRKPLSWFDKGIGAFSALGTASEYKDQLGKMQRAGMR